MLQLFTFKVIKWMVKLEQDKYFTLSSVYISCNSKWMLNMC